MDLYDILACPSCKVALGRREQTLICPRCDRTYPIVDRVPILLPDGSVPATQYQHELDVRRSYDPWIHRVVLQSLPASAIVLDLGAGNMALNLSNVIRMDVTLTPYVDVVGDAHALPFLPGTFDFIFSLAVFEHLRQPFIAAQEIYNALRNGGYIYHECNFVFAYHGYPHHYFNASEQGLEQVFASFAKLRSGVAPYQMPSFAIRMLLQTYLADMSQIDSPDVQEYRDLLQNVLNQPLGAFDRLFSEQAALRTAAGVYFFGRKSTQGKSDVIPAVVQAFWERAPELQRQFPNIADIGTSENIMLWAKNEGRQQSETLEQYFGELVPFQKSVDAEVDSQQTLDGLPVLEPRFANISDVQTDESFTRKVRRLEQYVTMLEMTIQRKNQHIMYLEGLIKRIGSGRLMKVLNRIQQLR